MSKAPTLTDPKGMGGVTAQAGFDYQLWDVLARLPGWLRHHAFEGLILEGLEDFEARFFAPHGPRPYFLDRFQAKSGGLSAHDIAEVFTSFKTFDEAHPLAARVQTLVTPALPPRLAWIGTNSERVRRARPFYRPFPDILAASDDKLLADLAAELGPQLGAFVASNVEVALRHWPSREAAEAGFAAALNSAFPTLDLSAREAHQVFSALADVVSSSRGTLITRRRLLEVLAATLGRALTANEALHLHVRSDVLADVPDALEIDACAFNGTDGTYPEPSRWRAELVEPLERTASWARDQRVTRIALRGSYRLSTALAFGWAFRSAAGFEIDIPTKSGQWATDSHPMPGSAAPSWSVSAPQALAGNRLVVGIGVLRSPVADILRSVASATATNVFIATLRQALTSATEAQASARVIKEAVADAVARFRPTGIDFFYVGPAALAVALGHRWNGFPPTQLWEFLSKDGRYTPTAVLGAVRGPRQDE
jgi:hypothetical protein